MIHYRISSVISILNTLAFKVDYIYTNMKIPDKTNVKVEQHTTTTKPNHIEKINEFIPNLTYILEFIEQIDKKHKYD